MLTHAGDLREKSHHLRSAHDLPSSVGHSSDCSPPPAPPKAFSSPALLAYRPPWVGGRWSVSCLFFSSVSAREVVQGR